MDQNEENEANPLTGDTKKKPRKKKKKKTA